MQKALQLRPPEAPEFLETANGVYPVIDAAQQGWGFAEFFIEEWIKAASTAAGNSPALITTSENEIALVTAFEASHSGGAAAIQFDLFIRYRLIPTIFVRWHQTGINASDSLPSIELLGGAGQTLLIPPNCTLDAFFGATAAGETARVAYVYSKFPKGFKVR